MKDMLYGEVYNILLFFFFFGISSFLTIFLYWETWWATVHHTPIFLPGFHLVVRIVGDECSYTESDFSEIGKMISVFLYTKVTT